MPELRNTVPLTRSQWSLAIVWYAGFGLLLVCLFWFTSVRPKEDHKAVWAWFSSCTAPAVVMITAALATGAFQNQTGEEPERLVDVRFYRLSMALSILYWLLLLSVFGLETWTHHQNRGYFMSSQVGLAPLQGVVVTVLTFLFGKPEPRRGEGEARAAKSE